MLCRIFGIIFRGQVLEIVKRSNFTHSFVPSSDHIPGPIHFSITEPQSQLRCVHTKLSPLWNPETPPAAQPVPGGMPLAVSRRRTRFIVWLYHMGSICSGTNAPSPLDRLGLQNLSEWLAALSTEMECVTYNFGQPLAIGSTLPYLTLTRKSYGYYRPRTKVISVCLSVHQGGNPLFSGPWSFTGSGLWSFPWGDPVRSPDMWDL